MAVVASQLRADIYNLLDQVLDSGQPLEIERRGQILRIVPPRRASWLERLPRRDDAIVGDPLALISPAGLYTWSPELP